MGRGVMEHISAELLDIPQQSKKAGSEINGKGKVVVPNALVKLEPEDEDNWKRT